MTSKFTESSDDSNMFFRQIRNNIEIGIAPMMYGYRIRTSIVGENTCWIDYCAGPDQKEAENIYSLVISIMNKRMDEFIGTDTRDLAYYIFNDFPKQNRKPMVNDMECFMKLCELCGPEIISIKLPNIHARKVRHIAINEPASFDLINSLGGFDDLLNED
jgi:hypothetical protein